MADYYPLIARAVAGLEKNTGDGRRALYERARTALVAQLRGVTPALNESDVTRERLALEEAIRKVEAESARQTWVEPARPEPPHRVRAPEMPRWEEPLPGAERRPPPRNDVAPRGSQGSRQQGVTQANGQATRGMFGHDRYVDPVFDQPISDGQPTTPSASARHPLRGRGAGDRRSLLDAGLKDFRNVVSETDELGEASARSAKLARENYADTHDAGPHDGDVHADDMESQLHEALLDMPAPRLLEPSVEDESLPAPRPYMPPPMPSEELASMPGRSLRDYIKIVVVLLVIAGFGGATALLWPTVTQFYHSMRAGTDTSTGTANTTTPAGRTKIVDRYEPGGAQQPPQQQASLPTGAPTGAAVAQRVVLYEEDPNDAAGKRFVGSAIWRTETISPGPGLPPELTVRADVEIPERQISMTWSLRRNTDPNLPATHTVEIVFKLPPDFPGGGVSNVPGILMKAAEQTRGVPLAGLAVKVTNGFFLIGLSSVEADRERNVSLLKERAWFDIPVVYNNNRRAILALEKGTPGERAFADAFRAWRQ